MSSRSGCRTRSRSSALKNALEWLSRPPNPPVNAKPCAVFGASVSPLGTARGQFHFRHVAVSLNMHMVNVPHVDITNAKSKFDAQSQLSDAASLDSLKQLVAELQALTNRLRAA
jgi:chromate reductase